MYSKKNTVLCKEPLTGGRFHGTSHCIFLFSITLLASLLAFLLHEKKRSWALPVLIPHTCRAAALRGWAYPGAGSKSVG